MQKKLIILMSVIAVFNIAVFAVNISKYNDREELFESLEQKKNDIDTAKEMLDSEKNKLLELYEREEMAASQPDTAEKKAEISVCIDVDGDSGLNTEIAGKIKTVFETYGIRCEISLYGNEEERAKFGNNCNYCIKLSCNSDGEHCVSAAVPEQCYFGDDSFVHKSSVMAQMIINQLMQRTGAVNYGLTTYSDVVSFNASRVPVTHIYYSNGIIGTEDYKLLIAQCVADGFMEFIKGSN